MNEHTIRRILEGGGGLAGQSLRVCLWIPGKLYGAVMAMRRRAYRTGVFASHAADVPVVSVGNITAGGSGKTPLVIMLADRLVRLGRRPGILLRGYRQSLEGLSDEAVLYRRHCPTAILEVDSDRVAAAARAVTNGADILLLDDGFQHLRIKRTIDIVMIDATAPWGGGNTIPGGLLREPRSALTYASAVVITRADQQCPACLTNLKNEIQRLVPGLPIFTACHRPASLYNLKGEEMPIEQLTGRKVIALSGIARPEAFHKTLESLGAIITHKIEARDHEHFDNAQLLKMLETAKQESALAITTEKDCGKEAFTLLNNQAGSVWVLGIRQELDDEKRLLDIISV